MDEDKLKKNRGVVDTYFMALENKKTDVLAEILAVDVWKKVPYAPEGFPKDIKGAEAVIAHYQKMLSQFTKVLLTRHIYSTESDDIFFAQFTGVFTKANGDEYRNHYVVKFKLRDYVVIEYDEYFDPIVMAKEFGYKLN